MQNCEFAFGDQCDLQGMHECDFTGLGKIRRVKNGFYFDCGKEAALTHITFEPLTSNGAANAKSNSL